MSENKTPEQIAAEALNQNWEEDATYERLGERVIDDLRAAGLLASSPTGDYRKLEDQIADTLAYYQCRETNPKADHPSMGYHAFSEEQREWLRDKKREAAAEIVRMMRAGAVSPTGDERDKLTLIARDVHLYDGGPHLSLLGLDAQRIADAILAAGFRLVNTAPAQRVSETTDPRLTGGYRLTVNDIPALAAQIDRLETVVDQLRNQYTVTSDLLYRTEAERDAATAAIERVRAICDETFVEGFNGSVTVVDWPRYENTFPVELLAALNAAREVQEGSITIPRPVVPHGPTSMTENAATAHYMRQVVRKIDDGYITSIGGSNVTATVRKLLVDVAEALEGVQCNE